MKTTKGKPLVELIPPAFLLEMGYVMADGNANGHKEDDWKTAPSSKPYLGASLRHILRYLDGDFIDRQSGCSHLAHAADDLAIAFALDGVAIYSKKENGQ